MNLIHATIIQIRKHQNISAVSFDAFGQSIRMVALELDEKLTIGTNVSLKVKATNISLAKEKSEYLSISNQLETIVQEIVFGELLCSVKLKLNDIVLESIITQESVEKLDITEGEPIIALIKASDVSIVASDEQTKK